MALGGINGANKLAISTATVPEQFTNRTSYLKEIVKESGGKNEWNTAQIEYLVALLDSNYIVSRGDCMPQLRKVSEATAVVHTAFLAPPVESPPVSVCLKEHHSPDPILRQWLPFLPSIMGCCLH